LRARERIIKQLSRRGVCSKMTRYSLRDLLVSGSGAWSPPVPLYHGAEVQGADSEELPLHCPPLDLEALRSGERTLASCKTSDGADYSAQKIQRGDQAVQRDSRSLLPWLGRALSYLQVALPELGGAVEGLREDFDKPGVDVEFQEEVPVEAEDAAAEPSTEVPVVSQEAPAPAEVDGSEDLPGPADEDSAEAAQEEEGGSEGVEADTAGEVEPGEEEPADEQQELAEDADPSESSELPAEAKAEEEVEPASQEETDGLPGSLDESEPESETEDEVEASQGEEPEEQKPTRERLRPCSDKGLDKTIPVDVVFSGARVSPKELIGIRCITKFLYMNRYIPSFEPFRSFFQVGTLSFDSKGAPEGEGSETMAASSMELLGRFGADALRIQLLCLGPADNSASFDDDSLYKIRRFLEKIWRAVCGRIGQGKFVSRNVLVAKHRLIFDVSKRLEELKFHTAISALREFVNFLASPKTTLEEVDTSTLKTFLVVLKPFAPHLAFELWERMGNEDTIDDSPWPEYSKELVEPSEREHAVFVNGQMIDRLTESVELDPKKLESRALALESVREFIGRRKVGRVEVVPGRLIWVCLGKNKPVKGNRENAAEDAAAASKTSAGEEPVQGKAKGSEKPENP
ncbi:MAG: class I tRNA ligase family protein, partial [Planctomycetota bacterium]|nr:class I tRNA ligase family protein [Planctomycetota bacterium]